MIVNYESPGHIDLTLLITGDLHMRVSNWRVEYVFKMGKVWISTQGLDPDSPIGQSSYQPLVHTSA